jgi:hypothetical protein
MIILPNYEQYIIFSISLYQFHYINFSIYFINSSALNLKNGMFSYSQACVTLQESKVLWAKFCSFAVSAQYNVSLCILHIFSCLICVMFYWKSCNSYHIT